MELLERRNVQRIEQETKVAFSVMSGGEFAHYRKIAHSLTRNISLSGIMIQSDVFIPVGAMLTIELCLEKNPEVITVIAKVKWVNALSGNESFAVGLEFVELPTTGLNALLSHLFAN
ncbi:PilZ domain-containing protein [Acidobacteriota bacterium]